MPSKLSNYVRLRYYQYEITFGLYMMEPIERVVLNLILLGIVSAILFAMYWGLEPFVVRSVCRLVWYVTGLGGRVEEVCGT